MDELTNEKRTNADERTDRRADGRTGGRTDGRTNRRTDGCGRMKGCSDTRTKGRTVGRSKRGTDGRTEGRRDEGTDGRTDGQTRTDGQSERCYLPGRNARSLGRGCISDETQFLRIASQSSLHVYTSKRDTPGAEQPLLAHVPSTQIMIL